MNRNYARNCGKLLQSEDHSNEKLASNSDVERIIVIKKLNWSKTMVGRFMNVKMSMN